MAEKHPKDMSIEELIADVKTLPNPERSLLSHNERVLIELAQALSEALVLSTTFQDKIDSMIPVGTAGAMPGTSGFTMAAFRADDVPVGTKLFREGS